ncbi:hypothetical protein [Kitasatospora sp. P5_F3]
MTHFTAERLLAAVAPLPHPLRLREVARAGAALAPSGELPALLAELGSGGPYERRLAALAAQAGRQTDYLAERLTDPDRVVRCYAHRAVGQLPVPDGVVEQALLDAPTAVRAELSTAVLRARRTALAERLVPQLRERWGAAEAARLLPVCSAEFVARELPGMAHAVAFSSSLGRRHPAAVLAEAERQLADLSRGMGPALWKRHVLGLAAAARAEPAGALGLMERHPAGKLLRPLRDRLADLAGADAERTVRLLLGFGRERYAPPLRRALARRLVRSMPPSLPELAHRYHDDHLALLRQLPPARRAAFFDSVAALPGHTLSWWGSNLLAVLPRSERRSRAMALLAERRAEDGHGGELADWLAMRVTEPGEDGSLSLLTVLPVAEGRPRLLEATRSAEWYERGQAWSELILAAGRSGDPEAVREVLELAERLRNEQDPVRREAVEAVAELGPDLLRTSAEPLARFTGAALDARDCSPDTRAQLTRLAVGALRTPGVPADWAVRAIERTEGHGLTLPQGGEEAVVALLRELLERSAGSSDARLLLTAADALGSRVRGLPVVLALLEQVLRSGDDAAYERAVGHLLGDPGTRDERVAVLLAAEPSAVLLAPVRAVLSRTRTDLLDRLLDAPVAGRFGRADHPLPDLSVADRWLPEQQRTVAGRLARTVDDPARSQAERTAAVRDAARVPGYGLALLRRWAAAGDTVVAEAALGALPWTEDPAAAVPALFALAGDERARVAMFAASRAARFARAGDLAPALGTIATGDVPGGLTDGQYAKVTSRKQAVRLAAENLPLDRAAELLSAAFSTPEQHSDVRLAVVGRAARRLGDERLWAVLDAAADGAPGLQQAVLWGVKPYELSATDRGRWAALVGRLAGSGDHQVSCIAQGQMALWARYAPQAVAGLARSVTALDEPGRWTAAARTLAQVALSDVPHPLGGCETGSVLADTLTVLVEAVRAGEPEGPDRDRPARRRIMGLVQSMWNWEALPEQARATRLGIAAILAAEPSLRPFAASQLANALDPESPDFGDRLAELAVLLADFPVIAAGLAVNLGGMQGSSEHVLAAAERLAVDGGLVPGLFAVALVTGHGARYTWAEPWRETLYALRAHPFPDVRHLALQASIGRD